MKTLPGLLLATLLAMTAGCAQKDWIDRTLVTVDVTGTWSGRQETGLSGELRFELEQQGSTVKGFLRTRGRSGLLTADPIDGTVAGDVFRFRNMRGDAEGELTVNGDEMNGRVSLTESSSRPISLRRVDSSSPPASPPR